MRTKTCPSSGILKDYLRELPSQLITKTLYQVVEEAMTLRPPPAAPAGPDAQLAQSTMELLSCLPPPERVTAGRTALPQRWCQRATVEFGIASVNQNQNLLQNHCGPSNSTLLLYSNSSETQASLTATLSFQPCSSVHSRPKSVSTLGLISPQT